MVDLCQMPENLKGLVRLYILKSISSFLGTYILPSGNNDLMTLWLTVSVASQYQWATCLRDSLAVYKPMWRGIPRLYLQLCIMFMIKINFQRSPFFKIFIAMKWARKHLFD